MDNRVLKVLGFVALMIAVTAAFKYITRDPLGAPEESRRLRHPDGYSIIGPANWVGSILQAGKIKSPMLKFVPDESIGVQPSMLISRSDKPYDLPGGKEVRDNAHPIQFQGQPATYYQGNEQNAWAFVLDFQRGSDYYRISLKLNVPEDVIRGTWWNYFESFRLETPLTPRTTESTSIPTLIVPRSN